MKAVSLSALLVSTEATFASKGVKSFGLA
jgi:hypothetical protein